MQGNVISSIYLVLNFGGPLRTGPIWGFFGPGFVEKWCARSFQVSHRIDSALRAISGQPRDPMVRAGTLPRGTMKPDFHDLPRAQMIHIERGSGEAGMP